MKTNIWNLVCVDFSNQRSQFKTETIGLFLPKSILPTWSAGPPSPHHEKCVKKWGWGGEKVAPVLDHRSEYTRRQQLLALELWLLREKLEECWLLSPGKDSSAASINAVGCRELHLGDGCSGLERNLACFPGKLYCWAGLLFLLVKRLELAIHISIYGYQHLNAVSKLKTWGFGDRGCSFLWLSHFIL